jgi:hypothetical protein
MRPLLLRLQLQPLEEEFVINALLSDLKREGNVITDRAYP